jgi:hypothetical protein
MACNVSNQVIADARCANRRRGQGAPRMAEMAVAPRPFGRIGDPTGDRVRP